MTRQCIETAQLPALRVFNYDSVATSAVIPFRFAGPGPRVMLTVKLLVTVMGLFAPFDWTNGGFVTWSIWLYRSILTDDGKRVPVQNLVGTRANPVRLDNGTTHDSVNGASIDYVGGGDGVDGELTVGLPSGSFDFVPNPVYAFLRGRYNAVAPLCDEEWARLDTMAGTSPDVQMQRFGTG